MLVDGRWTLDVGTNVLATGSIFHSIYQRPSTNNQSLDFSTDLCHTPNYECDHAGYARVRHAQLPYLCSVQQGDDWAA
jgi:hypothetical protein